MAHQLRPRWLSLIIALAVFIFMVGVVPQGNAKPKKESKEKTVTVEKSTLPDSFFKDRDPKHFVGSDTCKGCHEAEGKQIDNSPHYKTTLDTRKGPAWQGCEGCHGPGQEHVEGGGDKSKIFTFKGVASKKVSERCLECHQYGEEHANFGRSVHSTNDVSCIDCHNPHTPKQKEFLLTEKQPQLCYDCHNEVKADFGKPFKHRVEVGLVTCTDCHNEHGGFVNRQLRSTASQDAVCFKCHTEKAGPFVFEHAPVKSEGCVSCHTPHGSANPKLLKRATMNQLCLECHTASNEPGMAQIPTLHNQNQKYQACTLCHTAIHGSNFSNIFFK